MKNILASFFLFSSFFNCNCNSNKESEQATFTIVEKPINNTCSLYFMNYLSGDYMFSIGTMDSCKIITADAYINNYNSLLSTNFNKLNRKQGKIIFETNYKFGPELSLRNELINITEIKFKTKINVVNAETKARQMTVEIK